MHETLGHARLRPEVKWVQLQHFFAVGDRPLLAKAAGTLINANVTPALLAEASAALGNELDPHEDQQASSAMRRHLARVLLARCVSTLLSRPVLGTGGAA